MAKKFFSMAVSAALLIGSINPAFAAENNSPSAPVNVTVPAAATTYSSISIIWDKPEEYKDITGYNVYVNGEFAKKTAANETYYTAENLTDDTEYIFTVKALIGDDESEASNEVRARTDVKGIVRNVTEAPYNAKGDGTTLDTAAIQEAIDDCGDNDIVLIPEGKTFLTGALDLKSNMTLEVNGTLLSSTSAKDFEKKVDETKTYTGGTSTGVTYTEEAPKRLIWSRIEGWEQYSYRSLINIGYLDENTDYATDKNYVCENVKICGTGTITGDSGKTNYAPINGNATWLAIDEGKSADTFYDIENSETTENNIRSRIRGRLINVSNAQNVYIKGVTVARPPCWTIHMIYSDNVTTNGVDFQTSGYRNGDGWDPDSSTNCTLYDCNFSTGDDCVAIKSGKNPEGNAVARPSENIKILGCRSDGGLGLAVGSEMSGGVEGVYVRDCVLSNTRYGIELKANKVRGGYIRDFHVQDSTVDRVLIHSVTYNADGEPADTSPVFSDMSFKNTNIIGYYGYDHTWLDTSIEIEGFTQDSGGDDYYVKNILFEDVTVGTEDNTTQNISMKYCRDIAFNNVLQSDGFMPLYAAADTTFTVDGGDVKDIVPNFTAAIEAERMNLENFVSESNSAASNKTLVKVNSSPAAAKATYQGDSGTKDICVTYFDESDGIDAYTLYVNDTQIDTWDADTNRGSDSPDEKSLANHITKGVSINKGDTVKLVITVKKSGGGRFDKLEVGEPDSFTEITREELPKGISGEVDTANNTYIWTMGEADTVTTPGTVYSDTNDYADLTVSLGSGDSMYGGITFSASSVKEPNTNGQKNLNDTKRYLLVKPKYDGELNITIAFSDAGSNKKDRIYYADLGTDTSGIDLSAYYKGSHETAGDDITSTNAATRTIYMTAGHTYIIYTYQYASTISALSYQYIDNEQPPASDFPKYMHISFDDIYSCLKDITDNKDTYASVFDNSMLADLKALHNEYGAVFTLNCFIAADSYDISNLPDKYKDELAENSDWLKFSFHAQDKNAKYTTDSVNSITSQYNKFTAAILNATGTADSIDRVARLGFFTGSLNNVKALQNCENGIIGILTADDDRETNYYLDAQQISYLSANNKLYDEANNLYMLKSQTRLENVTTDSALNAQFAKFKRMEANGINMLEVFTHEYEYDNIKTTLTKYIQWAYNNGYKFEYAQNVMNDLKGEFVATLDISEPVIGNGKTNITIQNNTEEKKNAVLIVASYENGVMQDISVSDETEISPNGSVTLEAAVPTTAEYKIMVWDALGNMKPLYMKANNYNDKNNFYDGIITSTTFLGSLVNRIV